MSREQSLLRVGGVVLTAVLTGMLLTLGLFVASLIVVFERGKTTRIPGVVDYVATGDSMSVQPAGSLGLTFLVLVLVSFPLVWAINRKVRRR